MNYFLSAQKKTQVNNREVQTIPFQSKHSEGSIQKEGFNVSQQFKRQQSKENRWTGNLHQKSLLQIIPESIPIKQFTPINFTELNCYERLKNLLTSQVCNKPQDRLPQKNVEMLNNVVILQKQINKLQQKYRNKQNRNIKLNKTVRSVLSTKNYSFFERTSPNSSLNKTQKSFILNQRSKMKKMIQSPEKQNVEIKQTIKIQISQMKNACIQKFVAQKKRLNDQIFEQVYEFISNTIETKINDIISCKMKNTYQAEEENNKCKLILLQKQLEIQSLKKQLKIKEEKILKNTKMQQPQEQMIVYSRSAQQFYEEYKALFGSIKVEELKKKVQFLENIYVNQYVHEESKHIDRLVKAEQEKRQLAKKMNQKIKQYETKENQMRDIINRRRKYQQLDNSEETHQMYNKIPWYKMKADQLQHLQKFILNKYTYWISTKSEAQIKVIQLINNYKLQDYMQMVQAMLDFQKGFGDEHKQVQFISKICNLILKIKKVMTPNSIYKKLEPLKTLQQIQTYLLNLKRKQKKVKTINKTKQYLNDQQF